MTLFEPLDFYADDEGSLYVVGNDGIARKLLVRRLTPPPSVPAMLDRRTGDGWEDAVANQAVRIPRGDDYYTSDHWERCCGDWKIGRCSRCKQPGPTQLHHLTYKRLGYERPEDVIEICAACHYGAHFGFEKAA